MLGLFKSPSFPSLVSLEGPVVFTHTHLASFFPGLNIFLGTPTQSRLIPALQSRLKNASLRTKLLPFVLYFSQWGKQKEKLCHKEFFAVKEMLTVVCFFEKNLYTRFVSVFSASH